MRFTSLGVQVVRTTCAGIDGMISGRKLLGCLSRVNIPSGAAALGLAVIFLSASTISGSPGVMSLSGQFAVNQTGAATYAIPIALPLGTAGVSPSLSLEYNSHSG